MKYAYQYNGAPLLQWKGTAPSQTRAADARSLGSLGDDTLGAMPLPVPGGPEPIGCSSCKGGVGDAPSGATIATVAAVALGAYILFGRKRRR